MQIVKYPHPALRHKSKPLLRVDAEMRKIVRQMFDLMYAENGIGLAANQVELPYRLFIINLSADANAPEQEHVFINPVIERRTGGSAEADEGCLSFPGLFAPVRRAEKAVLSAYSLSGEEVHYDLNGLFARAVQHEYDHLDGKLFVDRFTPGVLASVKDRLDEFERAFYLGRQQGLIPPDQQIAAHLAQLEGLRT
ncbi:MAG: peptide deformylase [Thermoguttaceae bacterium]